MNMKQKGKPWNKGFTKFTHPGMMKTSQTMASMARSNFYQWQLKNKKAYSNFKKDGRLAELIGVVLGDGHIQAFPRTERLIVSSNSQNSGFIKRYKMLIKTIFGKQPLCMKSKNSNCVRISIYEKLISKRIGIQTGNRKGLNFRTPKWISRNKNYLKGYLRGLYEAEGSFCTHKPTGTYKFLFKNTNNSLLNIVYDGMKTLGFHPHRSKHQIQISKKEEVYAAQKMLKFRRY